MATAAIDPIGVGLRADMIASPVSRKVQLQYVTIVDVNFLFNLQRKFNAANSIGAAVSPEH
jgi:hypothetical protein